MAKYAVDLSPRAQQDLATRSPDVALRITRRMAQLQVDPHPRGNTLKRLQGFDVPTYRLRVGDYRVVYRIAGHTVRILRILHRSDLDRALRDLL